MKKTILPFVLAVLLLMPWLGGQTTQPAALRRLATTRPSPDRVVGWENRGAESPTAWRNVDFINPPPLGYTNSSVEQTLVQFARQGWTRVAVRSPWGTTPGDGGSPLGIIRFEQPIDCANQNFGFLDSSYRSMRAKATDAGIKEWIDYIGSPETAASRVGNDPLVQPYLTTISYRVLHQCGNSIGFDNTSGVAAHSYSMTVFARCEAMHKKVYLEAVPLTACPWLHKYPFFIQESFSELVDQQQADGHQADWAATRQQLAGERICILDQPPPGADWQNLGSEAWRAAAMRILARGDTLAAAPEVIMALWPVQ